MSFEEERIVKVTFDNAEFKKQIESTIDALNRFEKSLNIEPRTAGRSIETLNNSFRETERQISITDEAVVKLKSSFSLLQIAGYTAFSELTRQAMNFGKTLYANTIGQITSGGTRRALNIEAAKFQLKGIQIEWDAIKDDIDYAVSGTAYGLDEAAKVASQLSASNVKLGDDMKAALRGISGVAAMTNASYAEIGDIFTTVAGKGRLMGIELSRLAARGMNAADAIRKYINAHGDEFPDMINATEADIRDFVSKGKISFDIFSKAMDEAFGEHAKDANATFTGALSNMKAALSRVGEVFKTPWLEFKRQMFLSAIPAINNVKKVLAFSLGPQLEKVLNLFAGWVTKLSDSDEFMHLVYNVAMGLYSVVYNIVRAIDELFGGKINELFTMPEKTQELIGKLAKLTDVFILNGEAGNNFREIVKGIIKSLQIVEAVVKGIIFVLEPIWRPVLENLQKIGKSVSGYDADGKKIENRIDSIVKVINIFAVLLRIGVEKGLKLVIGAFKMLIGVIKIAGGVFGVIILVISKIADGLHKLGTFVYSVGENVADVIHQIGNKFVWLYDTIVEVFSGAYDGITGFFDGIKDKADSVLGKIGDLFGSKTVKKTVEVEQVVTTTEVKTTKEVKSQTANTDTKSKKMGAASLSSIGGSGYGVGGGILTGAIDDKVKETEDNVDKSVDNINNKLTTIGAAPEVKNSGMAAFLGTFGEKIDTLIEKSGPIFEKLEKHFSNFWAVVADVFIGGAAIFTTAVTVTGFKAVNAIINMANFLPDVGKALKDAAAGLKYQGLAEAFRGMVPVMLAFAALLVVIAVVSKVVDPQAFQKVSLAVAALIAAHALLLKAVGVFALVGSINKLISKIPGGKISKTQTKMTQMSAMFKNLAILLGVVVGSILAIYAVAEKTNGYAGILKAATLIVGIVGAIMLMTTLMAKAVGDKASSKSTKTFAFSLNALTNETESSLGGLIKLVQTVIPLIAVLTASALLLKDMKMTKLLSIFSVFAGMFVIIFGGIFASILYMSKFMRNMAKDGLGVNVITRGMKQILTNISAFIMSISGFMLAFAVAAGLLSIIPEDKMGFATKMMGIAVGLIIGILVTTMGALAAFMAIDKKTGNMQGQMEKFSTLVSSIGDSLSGLIKSMSMLFIAISASIILLSTVSDPERLEQASNTMLKVMLAAAGFMVVIGIALKSFSASFKSSKGSAGSFDIKGIEATSKQLKSLFAGIGVLITTIAGSLALMAFVQKFGDINAGLKAMTKITIIMGIFTVAMLAMIRSIDKSMYSVSGSNADVLKESKSFSTISDNAGKMILQIMGGMSIFLGAVAVSMSIISRLSPEEITLATTSLATIMMIMGTSMSMLTLAMTFLAKESQDDKSIHFAKILKNMISLLIVFTGCTVLLMGALGLLIVALDKLKPSEQALAGGVTILIGTILALTSAMVVISKIPVHKSQMKQMITLAVLAGSLATMMLSIAAVIKIMSTIDFDAATIISSILVLVVAIGTVIGGIIVLGKFGAAAMAAMAGLYKVMLAVAALVGGVIALLFGISYGIQAIGNTIQKFVEAVESIKSVDWEDLKTEANAMKGCMAIIATVFTENLNIGAVIQAAVMSVALYLLVSAMQGIKSIDPANIWAFGDALAALAEALNGNQEALIMAMGTIFLIGLVGGILGISIAILAAGILAAVSLLPAIANMLNAGITAFANNIDSIGDGMVKIAEKMSVSFNKIADAFRTVDFDGLLGAAGGLAVFGILMLIAGVSLAIGAIGLLAGLALVNVSLSVLEIITEKLSDFRGRDFERLKEFGGDIGEFAVIGIIAGLLLDLAATALLAGMVQLLGAVALLGLTFKLMDKFIGDIDMAVQFMFKLGSLVVTSLAVGVLMVLASVPLFIGAILFATAAGLISLSLLALDYVFNNTDIDNIRDGLLNFTEVIFALGAVAASIWTVGIALIAAMAIVMVVGLLFSVAAVAISVGIIALASAFIVGSLMLLGGAYLLGMALEQLNYTFMNVDPTELLTNMSVMIGVGAAILVFGLVISIAAVPLLLGSGMLLIASLALITGVTNLTAATSGTVINKLAKGMATFKALSNAFINNAGTFLKAGLILDIVAAMVFAAGFLISKGVNMMASSLLVATTAVMGFVAVGENIVNGLLQGIQNKARDLAIAVTKLAEGDVLGAFNAALGIHSPAREFIKSAGNIIGGIVSGLGGDGDKVNKAITDVGNGALDTFDSFKEGFKSVGASVGEAGGNSLAENLINSAGSKLQDGLGKLGSFWGDGLSSIFNKSNKEMIVHLQAQLTTLNRAIEPFEQYGVAESEESARLRKQRQEIQAQLDALQAEEAGNSFFSQDDLPGWEGFKTMTTLPENYNPGGSGAPELAPETANALAEAGGAGSGGSLASTAGSNVGTSITNNNYNFVQNNYSPKPIDRTELYTQTQNQLDTWYNFVRDNG